MAISLQTVLTSTPQMYRRGQIHVPAALLSTSWRGVGVNPTAILDYSLATSPYCRQNGAPSYMMLELGLSNLRQENGTRDGADG